MSEQKQNGPRLKIIARCDGCVYEHSEHYSIEDGNDVDSGETVYCKHPAAVHSAPKIAANGYRYVGDTTWSTPDWCRLLPASLSDLLAGLKDKVAP